MSDLQVEFGELPPRRRGKGRVRLWEPIVAQLAERPGEWAKVRTCTSPTMAAAHASHVANGKAPGVPAGTVEATARGKDVWMRYVGPKA